MEFKLIKECYPNLEKKIIDFCLHSKPYPFCENKSRQLSLFKIKEYISFLFGTSEIYILEQNENLFLFVAMSKKEETAIVDFIFGQPNKIIPSFKEFRLFFKHKNPEITLFFSEVTRKHNLKGYLRFIEKTDLEAKIKLDNQKICVLWNT
jgi:hypothetical protein